MYMSRFGRTAAVILAFAAGTATAGAAQAAFFVRPVLQYGGELQEGLSLNDQTSGSATFSDGSTTLESHVDLSAGTIKTFLQMNGPSDVFAGATGVMGDRIRYTGSSDEAVSFYFDYDSIISADQSFTGTPEEFETRYIGVQAHFAIYEAGSGATWDDWTAFGSNADKAIYVDFDSSSFESEPESFSLTYSNRLGTELFLTSGKSYDIFAAFNLIVVPGTLTGSVTMDSLNTSTIGFEAPGGTFTSESGEFLGLAQTAAVPEPATWALLIAGFGMVGSTLRRRTARFAV